MKTPLKTTDRPAPPSSGVVWDELDRASHNRFAIAQRPAGSFTTTEFAAKYKIYRGTALERLRRLEREGVVERCGIVRGATSGGRGIAWRLVTDHSVNGQRRTR